MPKPSAPVVKESIADRLHITSAAIFEGLRLQALRGKRTFTLREDDNLA